MCGIAGFVDYNKNSSETDLARMTDALLHRGPDSSGYDITLRKNVTIGLGHRRLSIIDLTDSASQPMVKNGYKVVFNGEIYNFKELKIELESLGKKFVSHSDTEVLLHAYAVWGINCVNKFIGMFAFVIYDEQNDELICVRDRAGIKPFYYYLRNGLFLFGSELKAFQQHPGFIKELNNNAVASFIQHGYVPTPACIFNNCAKLKPGHYLKINLNTQSFSLEKYWDVFDAYSKPKLNVPFEEAKLETERIIKSAAEYRMISDVPVGVFLSGGYDSSLLTAVLQKERTNKIKTYTIAVPDINLNEAPYAKEIAEYLDTDHTEFMCTQKEALELIPQLPNYFDEPFADSSSIPTALLSRMVRKEVKVALSADGGDEIFAGYNRYDYLMNERAFIKKTPKLVRKSAAFAIKRLALKGNSSSKGYSKLGNRYEKLKHLLNDPSVENLIKNLNVVFTSEQLKQIFTTEFNFDKEIIFEKAFKEQAYSPLSFMMATDYQTYLLDDILQKVDRASMSQSLEAREPFLDYRLIEYVAQLPDEFKYHKGIKKHLLREITHQYIPQKLLDRPKMGFAIPMNTWLANDLKYLLDEFLNENFIVKQNIFRVEFINEIKSSFLNGNDSLTNKIWYLITFQMWYKNWMM